MPSDFWSYYTVPSMVHPCTDLVYRYRPTDGTVSDLFCYLFKDASGAWASAASVRRRDGAAYGFNDPVAITPTTHLNAAVAEFAALQKLCNRMGI